MKSTTFIVCCSTILLPSFRVNCSGSIPNSRSCSLIRIPSAVSQVTVAPIPPNRCTQWHLIGATAICTVAPISYCTYSHGNNSVEERRGAQIWVFTDILIADISVTKATGTYTYMYFTLISNIFTKCLLYLKGLCNVYEVIIISFVVYIL